MVHHAECSHQKNRQRRVLGLSLVALLALIPLGFLAAPVGGTGTIPVNIESSANPVDAGLPFALTAWVGSAEAPTYDNWTDSLGGSHDGPTWNLKIDESGILTVTLRASDLFGDRGEDTLTIPVMPPPSVSVSSPLDPVDAGFPAPVFLDVQGGVPPLRVNWTPFDGYPDGNATWFGDGNYTEQVDFVHPGPGWILAQVTDALGDSTSDDHLVTEVATPGSITLATNGTVAEVGAPLGVAAGLTEGAPPFRWSLASSLPLTGSLPPYGPFPTDGTYRWNVSFAFPGVAILNLTAIDAVGAPLTTSAAVAVEPALAVHLNPPDLEPSTPFQIDANVSGGLAPYDYHFLLSDGAGTSGSLTVAGSVSTTFDPFPGTNYSLEVSVTDALGQRAVSTELVRVSGTASMPPDPPDSTAVYGAVAFLAVAGLVGAFYLRRRFGRSSGTPATPESSALPTVRQLMEQSQIIDRETLLLLSEEAGESAEASRAAIQVLIRTGEVSTEPGPAHDEVLRWKGSASGRNTPTELP